MALLVKQDYLKYSLCVLSFIWSVIVTNTGNGSCIEPSHNTGDFFSNEITIGRILHFQS